jgi:hypothetical protein
VLVFLSLNGSIKNLADIIYHTIVVLGSLGTLVGLVLLGVATLRARVLPGWCALLLLIVGVELFVRYAVVLQLGLHVDLFLSRLGFYTHSRSFDTVYYALVETALGLSWLAPGYVLWWRVGVPAGQSTLS